MPVNSSKAKKWRKKKVWYKATDRRLEPPALSLEQFVKRISLIQKKLINRFS